MDYQRSDFVFISFCVLSILSCVLQTVLSQSMPDRSRTVRYPFTTDMDQDGKFVLRWNFNETHIWFEVQAHTLGYIGFGISDTERMIPADVVVGYVKNGQVFFGDFHTVGYYQPVRDTSQDWYIDYGYEENGWTVLGFHRLLDTCDTNDRVITTDTASLIYSYDAQDPESLESMQHHDKRGHKGVNLLTMPKPPPYIPADSFTEEFLNENHTIPSTDPTSTFRCRVFDLSGLAQKYHIIKASPIFTPETKSHVHHVTLYRCYMPNPDTIFQGGASFDCFTDAPGHLQFCREHVASFGQGDTEFYLPEDVGIPLGGGTGEPNVYVLATQYQNEDYVPNLVDNSGIQLTFTAELRPHDAAFLSIGNIISPNWLQFIPPGDPNFVQSAYCSMRCLLWGNEDCNSSISAPMTVAGVQFHSHSMGKTMKLRHLHYAENANDAATEKPWLAHDDSYDPRHQSFRALRDRKNITCRDGLLLECGYDSTGRNRPTVGGWTHHDELCRAYVLYYPRKRIEGCMSWSNYDQFVDSSNNPVNSTQVFATLARTNWADPSSETMRKNLKRALKQSYENGQCWSSRRQVSYAIDFFKQPLIKNVYTKPKLNKCA